MYFQIFCAKKPYRYIDYFSFSTSVCCKSLYTERLCNIDRESSSFQAVMQKLLKIESPSIIFCIETIEKKEEEERKMRKKKIYIFLWQL